MKAEALIPVEQFCAHYEIEFSFINALAEHGLIEIIMVEDARYLHEAHISNIEKMIHMHYDLDINPEGIDVIFQLLERIKHLQSELNSLRNRLNFYENE